MSKGSGFYARLEPMHKTLVDEVRPAILALMGAVIFLLLIACANVANLLLVRSSLRQPELAVRAALGAGRGRVDSADAGGGACPDRARRRRRRRARVDRHSSSCLSIAPANLPRLETIRIDPIVLLFALAIALAAACLFGMVPAWSAFRMDLVNALGGAARTSGLRGGGRLFSNAVVVVEVALCFVLLVGSGLMIRSFLELQRIDPGFDPRGLLTFQLLGGGPATHEQGAATGRQLEERLRALPGVQSVTASFPFPLAGGFSTIRWGLEDALADTSKFQAVDWQVVRPATSRRCARRSWRGGRSPRRTTIRNATSWWSTPCWPRRRFRMSRPSASAS